MRAHQYDGIGYEFADDDPYTGIDLDDAIDLQTKQLKPWAQAIVDQLHSYTELSPSGTGVKIWVKAKKPNNDRSRIKHEDGEIEIYDHGRYLARVLLPGRCFYIWGGYANVGNYPPVLKATGLYFSQALIWDKQHPVLTRKDYMGAHEWCFYGWKEGPDITSSDPTMPRICGVSKK